MKRKREIAFETEKIVICGELLEINWCDARAASGPKVTAKRGRGIGGDGRL